MTKLLKYLKGYVPEAVIAPLSKYVEAIIELLVPFLVQAMIDDGINPDGKTNSQLFLLLGIDVGGGSHTDIIITLGVIMIGLAAVGLCFSLVCQYLASKAAVGFGCNVRRALYHHIHNMELSKLDSIGTGTLINRLGADVSAAQHGIAMFLRLMLRSPFLAVGAVVMCLLVAPGLWYIYISAAVLCFIVLLLVMRLSVPKYTKVQKELDGISSLTGETMKGQRVIRAFASEDKSAAKFKAAAGRQTKASTSAAVISSLLSPAVTVIVNIAVIVILYVGSGIVVTGNLTTGSLVALINYMTQMMLAFITLAVFMVIISKSLTGARRINEIFDIPLSKSGGGADAHGEEIISMEDAAFSFGGGENAVEGLTFTLKRGEVLGVTGTTGSGKSTLASLAARLLLPTSGRVKLMGNDSGSYTDAQISEIISFAPQRALLFSGTVRSNLRWGGDASDEEMNAALEASDALGFVNAKRGLDSEVNQKGSNFSGGEKQRLSLARALLKSSSLFIIDDATSALDYVTSARVKRNVMERSRDKAVILISGRIGMIKNADRIIVLDGGKVVGCGTHDELLNSCGLYGQLDAKS